MTQSSDTSLRVLNNDSGGIKNVTVLSASEIQTGRLSDSEKSSNENEEKNKPLPSVVRFTTIQLRTSPLAVKNNQDKDNDMNQKRISAPAPALKKFDNQRRRSRQNLSQAKSYDYSAIQVPEHNAFKKRAKKNLKVSIDLEIHDILSAPSREP